MSKTTNVVKAIFAIVAAIALTLVVASPASAAKAGSSTLQLKKQTFEAFADIGIGVEPTGKAKFNKNGLHIPISSGKVDPETGKAKFVHKGGVEFSMNGYSISLDNLIAKIASKNVIKAEVGGGKTRFADLNTKKLDIQEKKNGKFLYSNIKVFIAKKGAKAIEKALHLSSDYDLNGVKLGKLTTKFKSKG
jgi:hypothetical protein